MKAILLLCSLICSNALAQDLRLIGTNLFEFTYASADNSPYIVSGQVLRAYPKSADLGVVTDIVYVADAPTAKSAINNGGGREGLTALAAFRMSHDEHGNLRPLRAGAFAMLSPEMKSYFVEQPLYKHQTVFNLPEAPRVGDELSVLALPLSNGTFDHGVPYSGSLSNFAVIFRLYPDHIAYLSNSPPRSTRRL